MNPRFYFSPLALALTLASTAAKAAVPLPLYQLPFEQIKQNFQLVLPDYAKTAQVLTDSLQFVKEATDDHKLNHVRMQQYFEGVPVWGGYAILHSANSAKELATPQAQVQMTGMLYLHLESELGQPKPDFIKNADLALLQFKKEFAGQKIAKEKVIPMVYMDNQSQAHWAYKVSLWMPSQQGRPKKPTAILNAQTYKPLVQWDDVKTNMAFVRGRGYGGNAKTGTYQFGEALPYLQITRQEDLCTMQNKGVMIIDMNHRYSAPKQAMKFFCPLNPNFPDDVFNTGKIADGYDEFNGAYSPSNDALYAGDVIQRLYADWYQIPVLTKQDGKTPMQLVMRVHYGIEYENAYWDGKQMTFGDGGRLFYPLVSIGVAAHEVSHGFTQQHSDLIYYGESGGINESFSDMAAQAAEFYSFGKNTWQIGAEIIKKEHQALRYMDLPSKDGRSFDNANQYYAAAKKDPGRIEVHSTSGVFNHLFYILAHQTNWTLPKAFDVMVRANMYYWGPYDNFKAAGCGLLYAAKDLGYSVEDVKNSLKEVTIDYDKCG